MIIDKNKQETDQVYSSLRQEYGARYEPGVWDELAGDIALFYDDQAAEAFYYRAFLRYQKSSEKNNQLDAFRVFEKLCESGYIRFEYFSALYNKQLQKDDLLRYQEVITKYQNKLNRSEQRELARIALQYQIKLKL